MVAFVDFLVGFAILGGLMVWYHFMPGWQVLLLPGSRLFRTEPFLTRRITVSSF
jgi:hypothetical protein